MPLRYLDDPGYTAGMIRDEVSWRLPPGAVYDAANMFFDSSGIARMRGGTTKLSSPQTAAFANMLGWSYSLDLSGSLESLYAIGQAAGDFYSMNPTTGAIIQTFASAGGTGTANRPVRHFGHVLFPIYNALTGSSLIAAAGYTGANVVTTVATATVVAGNPLVTLSGADVTTNAAVGMCVLWTITGSSRYNGRLAKIVSATTFTVNPVPSVGGTIAIGMVLKPQAVVSSGGGCMASFQNRLLLGNSLDVAAAQLAAPQVINKERRFIYSMLPTENNTTTFAGTTLFNDGANYLEPARYQPYNYVEVGGTDPIIGMQPISENELLILTSTHPTVFRGNLVTQLSTTSQQVTFDVTDIDTNAGCLSDLTIQNTPIGVVWAGAEGIFSYKDGVVTDLTKDKINTYWHNLVRGASFSVFGSFYTAWHYIINVTSASVKVQLSYNCRTGAWSRHTNLDFVYGLQRPTDASQCFALRGTTGASSGGGIQRVESILDPYTAGSTRTDADAASISPSITTRTLIGDLETQKWFPRSTVRYAAALGPGSGVLTVTAQSRIDAGDSTAPAVITLGTLGATEARAVTAATNATPIVLSCATNHGVLVGDFVDVSGVTPNTNANGRWRVAAVTALTLTLLGSTGNGATAAAGTFKKVTETDFMSNTVDQGQGILVTVAATSGRVDNFELHGLRVAYFQKAPVMSA